MLKEYEKNVWHHLNITPTNKRCDVCDSIMVKLSNDFKDAVFYCPNFYNNFRHIIKEVVKNAIIS